MVVIGISGIKGSGKDTIADHLVEHHNFIKVSFADVLKDGCKAIFGFNDRQLYGDLKEVIDDNWGITPRQAMQFVGTDLFRNQIKLLMPWIKDTFWIQCTLNKIKQIQENTETCNKNIVIADIRFENEVDAVKQINGKIINITRDNLTYNDACEHESEKYIDHLDYDHKIYNNSSFTSLYLATENVLTLLGIDN